MNFLDRDIKVTAASHRHQGGANFPDCDCLQNHRSTPTVSMQEIVEKGEIPGRRSTLVTRILVVLWRRRFLRFLDFPLARPSTDKASRALEWVDFHSVG